MLVNIALYIPICDYSGTPTLLLGPLFISLIRACVSNEMLERGISVRGKSTPQNSRLGVCRLVL